MNIFVIVVGYCCGNLLLWQSVVTNGCCGKLLLWQVLILTFALSGRHVRAWG